VNAFGIVVGTCTTDDMHGAQVNRAFVFSQGFMGDLGTFIRDPAIAGNFLGNSDGKGINDFGQIVGTADDINGPSHAFMFEPTAGQIFALSSFPGLPTGTPDPSEATAINNAAQIVGNATLIDAAGAVVQQAFLTQGTIAPLTPLGTLLPDPFQPGLFFGNSTALALNQTGSVVGNSDALPPLIRSGAIFSNPNIPFGPAPSEVFGINNNGQVVGHFFSNPAAPVTTGFIFDFTSGLVDLNTQLATADWHIDSATGINDAGQICGVGTHNVMGGPRAILLTP
jgi:probable HAF family extracellular repeat protein